MAAGGFTNIAHRLRAGQALRLLPPIDDARDGIPARSPLHQDAHDMDVDLIELTSKLAAGILGWREVRPSGTALIGIPPPGLVPLGGFLADDVAEVPPYARSMQDLRPVISWLEARGWVHDTIDISSMESPAYRATFARVADAQIVERQGFGETEAVATARAACRTQGIEP